MLCWVIPNSHTLELVHRSLMTFVCCCVVCGDVKHGHCVPRVHVTVHMYTICKEVSMYNVFHSIYPLRVCRYNITLYIDKL